MYAGPCYVVYGLAAQPKPYYAPCNLYLTLLHIIVAGSLVVASVRTVLELLACPTMQVFDMYRPERRRGVTMGDFFTASYFFCRRACSAQLALSNQRRPRRALYNLVRPAVRHGLLRRRAIRGGSAGYPRDELG